MAAILGSLLFDVWNGPAPPPVKATVELLYKPGQSAAAARVLPNQSTASEFEAIAFAAWADAHTLADSYRGLIGSIVALNYAGTSYGNVLVKDVTVSRIEKLLLARGVHPDSSAYLHSPAGRVVSQWQIVRLV